MKKKKNAIEKETQQWQCQTKENWNKKNGSELTRSRGQRCDIIIGVIRTHSKFHRCIKQKLTKTNDVIGVFIKRCRKDVCGEPRSRTKVWPAAKSVVSVVVFSPVATNATFTSAVAPRCFSLYDRISRLWPMKLWHYESSFKKNTSPLTSALFAFYGGEMTFDPRSPPASWSDLRTTFHFL